MKKNEYTVLADEYADNIRKIEESISECLESRKKAKTQKRYAIVSKLNSNLAMLYRQRSELKDTESLLRKHDSNREDKKAG